MLLNVLNSYKQPQNDVVFILAYLLAFNVSQKYPFYTKKHPRKREGIKLDFLNKLLVSS